MSDWRMKSITFNLTENEKTQIGNDAHVCTTCKMAPSQLKKKKNIAEPPRFEEGVVNKNVAKFQISHALVSHWKPVNECEETLVWCEKKKKNSRRREAVLLFWHGKSSVPNHW